MPYKTVKQKCTRSDGKKGKYVLKYKPKSPTKKKKDSQGFVKAGCHTSKKKASGQRAAIEGGPREADEVFELDELLSEIDELTEASKDSSGHLKQYSAPEGSERDKKLDQTKADLKKVKELRKKGKSSEAKKLEQRAYNRRERMEKPERTNEAAVRRLVRKVLIEALSAKTKKALDKKAEKRGFTKGSVYKEFKKGLAAYASSGSRKGMTAHQWAYARVNSATPSKDWAVVKKSKAKKKK
tara:strand:+ start:25030 stop:25749 length:720 start_codon:yes stop_codon:yes gene_type:complete